MTGWATYPYGCGGSLLHLGRPDPATTWDWLQVTEFSSLESLCSSRREFAEKRCKGIAIILVSPFQKKKVLHIIGLPRRGRGRSRPAFRTWGGPSCCHGDDLSLRKEIEKRRETDPTRRCDVGQLSFRRRRDGNKNTELAVCQQ